MPHFKVGQKTYMLDSKNPLCPYIGCHNGESCKACTVKKGGHAKRGFCVAKVLNIKPLAAETEE